jgi:putative ABC transport system permease protein
MNAIWQDVRYAIRSFRRNPTFTVVAVTVLAVGMSLNAAIFAMVNAVLLRPLPVRAPGQIRYVYALSRDGQLTGVSYRDYLILLTRNQAFTDIAACAPDDATLLVDGDNRTVPAFGSDQRGAVESRL